MFHESHFLPPGTYFLFFCIIGRHNYLQFVGAETAHGALPLLATLRAENKGALFSYSIEADHSDAVGASEQKESVCDRIVKEIITSINVAAEFEDGNAALKSPALGRRTWVSIKLVSCRYHRWNHNTCS